MSAFSAQNGTKTGTEIGTKPKLSADQKKTAQLLETLPKGISMGEWTDGRRKPFFVRYGVHRTVESFETEHLRNLRVEALMLKAEEDGKSSLDRKASEDIWFNNFKRRTGATNEQIELLWDRYSSSLSHKLTVKEAVERYLKLRLSEDIREKTDTYRQMKLHLLDYLAGVFGDSPLSAIKTEDLRALLADTKARNGKDPASAVTKRNYRKDWVTFFKRACAEKWLTENPCATLVPPGVVEEDKTLLSIPDAFKFLKANLKEPVLPRIALEMWGFMRASAAGRVQKEHVRFEEKGLYMPGQVHKSGKRKYRQGHPEVLWEWLALATDETWGLSERMYDKRKGEAFTRAQVVNDGNILRHSCISYMLAATRSFPTVSYLAQHTNTSTTEGYEGVARESDAKLWLKLTPRAVAGTWEDFLSSNQLTKAVE